jgi:hypothetical protein
MFFGETNFGFWVGANSDGNAPYYRPMTTSYGVMAITETFNTFASVVPNSNALYYLDFDAVLTEAGDYTEKYMLTIALSEKYGVPQLARPEMILESLKSTYPTAAPQLVLTYKDFLEHFHPKRSLCWTSQQPWNICH